MLKIADIDKGNYIRCIENNIYVGSPTKGLIMLSADGTKQETLSETGCRFITVFNNTLCYVDKDVKEVQLFKDNIKIDTLTLPFEEAQIFTLESS